MDGVRFSRTWAAFISASLCHTIGRRLSPPAAAAAPDLPRTSMSTRIGTPARVGHGPPPAFCNCHSERRTAPLPWTQLEQQRAAQPRLRAADQLVQLLEPCFGPRQRWRPPHRRQALRDDDWPREGDLLVSPCHATRWPVGSARAAGPPPVRRCPCRRALVMGQRHLIGVRLRQRPPPPPRSGLGWM